LSELDEEVHRLRRALQRLPEQAQIRRGLTERPDQGAGQGAGGLVLDTLDTVRLEAAPAVAAPEPEAAPEEAAVDPLDQAGLDEGLLSFSLPHSRLYRESL
jgi:hypothetical protein